MLEGQKVVPEKSDRRGEAEVVESDVDIHLKSILWNRFGRNFQ
jgi:hypothetical protein